MTKQTSTMIRGDTFSFDPQHYEARRIVDVFEDILDEYDITVPSPEDDDREKDNAARLYGSVYWSLVDAVEEYLKTIKKEKDE